MNTLSNEMWDVLQNLQIWNCRILDIIYNDISNIHSIAFTDANNIIMGLIISPHNNNNNNNNKFIVRAEIIDNFNKWDNCIYEKEYNWEKFYSDCYNPIILYQELLLSYYEIYKNLK